MSPSLPCEHTSLWVIVVNKKQMLVQLAYGWLVKARSRKWMLAQCEWLTNSWAFHCIYSLQFPHLSNLTDMTAPVHQGCCLCFDEFVSCCLKDTSHWRLTLLYYTSSYTSPLFWICKVGSLYKQPQFSSLLMCGLALCKLTGTENWQRFSVGIRQIFCIKNTSVW